MALLLCVSAAFLLVLAGACLWLFHVLSLERAVSAAQRAVQPPSPPWLYPAAPGALPAPPGLSPDAMQAAVSRDTDAAQRQAENERYMEELRAEFPELAYALAEEKEPDAEPINYE